MAGEEVHPRLSEEIARDEIESRPIGEIREGDAFVDGGAIQWVARGNAVVRGGEVFLEIQYRDGGLAERAWERTEYTLPILAAAE